MTTLSKTHRELAENPNLWPTWVKTWNRWGDDMHCPECGAKQIETHEHTTECLACQWSEFNPSAAANDIDGGHVEDDEPEFQACCDCGKEKDGPECAKCGRHVCHSCETMIDDDHYCDACVSTLGKGRCEGCDEWFKQNDLIYEDGVALCSKCNDEVGDDN